jgi:hypothetical protein
MKPIALITSDDNKDYTEFVPVVTEFWKKIGFDPVYLKLGDKYPVVEDVPTSLQAQILRLFAPAEYRDRIVLISDIDMIPLSGEYFISKLPKNDEEFSIYSSDAYEQKRYPMCYVASLGKNFDIFKDSRDESWKSFVLRLNSLGYGWNTDELYMYDMLTKKNALLQKHNRRWTNGIASMRVDRVCWKTTSPPYIDAHCPRPYSKFKKMIDELTNLLN